MGKASRFRKIRRTCIDLLQISTNYIKLQIPLAAGGRDALAARHGGYQCPTLCGSLIAFKQTRELGVCWKARDTASCSWSVGLVLSILTVLVDLGSLPQSAGERGGSSL